MKYLDQVREQDFALYAANSPKLQELFLGFKSGKKVIFSWKGLVFGGLWLAYHRLYKESALFLVIIYILTLAQVHVGVLVLWLIIGFLGQRQLVNKGLKVVIKSKELYKDEEVFKAAISGKFKPSILAVIMMFLCLMPLGAIADHPMGAIADHPSFAPKAGSSDAKSAGITYQQEGQNHIVTTPKFRVKLSPPMVREVIDFGYDNQLKAPEGATFVFFNVVYTNISNSPVNSDVVGLGLIDEVGRGYDADWDCTVKLRLLAALDETANFQVHQGVLNPSVTAEDYLCIKVSKSFIQKPWDVVVIADKKVRVTP